MSSKGLDENLPRGSLPRRPLKYPAQVQIHTDGGKEKIFRLDSHTYVIYSLGKISTNQVCPKAKSISAIEHLRTKIAGKFDADVLIQELETMTKEARTTAQEGILSHWIFTSPGAMIGGTILCLAILFYCWKACNRGQTPLPYPPAPTAPTVFKMTVDPIRRWRLDSEPWRIFPFHFLYFCRLSVIYFTSVKLPKEQERYTITK